MDESRISALFHESRPLSGPERERLFEGVEPEVRAEVESLLAHHDRAGVLEPAWEGALDAEPDATPASIAGFRIIGRLGQGGVGTVFEAEQARPQRRVALKVLHTLTEQSARRFEFEAQSLARLQHPGIAQLYAQGTEVTPQGRCPYLAMELVRGVPLTKYARALDLRSRVDLIARVTEAVAHAHRAGIIHRDLKPQNILVTDSGDPKVLDFGLARAVDAGRQFTNPGHLLGTLAYMSPEQALGRHDAIDTRSDVYSLGVVAYEVFRGELPFDPEQLELDEALRLITDSDPPSISSVDGDLALIVGKAMAKDPNRRYSGAAEFAADLRRYLNHEPILARAPTARYQLRKFVRRNRAMVGGAALAVAALAAGLVLALLAARDEARERERAESRAAVARLGQASAELEARHLGAARAALESIPERYRGLGWRCLHSQLDSSLEFRPSARNHSIGFARVASMSRFRLRNGTPELPPASITETAVRRGVTIANGAWYYACFDSEKRYQVLHEDGTPLPGFPLDPRRRAGVLGMAGSEVGPMIAWRERGVLRVRNLEDGHEFETPERGTAGAMHWDRRGRVLARNVWRDIRLTDRDGRPFGAGTMRRANHQAILSFAFSADLSVLAEGGNDRVAKLWDTKSGEKIARFPHPSRIRSVCLNASGDRLLTGSRAGEIRVWDCTTGRCVEEFRGHVQGVDFMRLSADETELWSSGADGIRRWSFLFGNTIRHHSTDRKAPHAAGVAFSPDGSMFASCGWDGWVRLYDSVSRELLYRWNPGEFVADVEFSRDGMRLFADGQHHHLHWDLETGRPISPAPIDKGGSGGVSSVFAVGLDRVFDRQLRGGLFALDAKSGKMLWSQHSDNIGRLALSPDESRLASAGASLRLRRTRDGELLWSRPMSGLGAVVFSHDARTLIVGDNAGMLHFVEARTGETQERIFAHAGKVHQVALSPDGRTLLTAGDDNLIRAWDAASGEHRFDLHGHTDYVHDVAFRPDGGMIVSASGDGTVRLWSTRPLREDWAAAQELRAAEARIRKGAQPATALEHRAARNVRLKARMND